MHFVKSGVYLQEITESGVKEQEIDIRDPEEKKREERLRQLPEFTTDPGFKSLSEQLRENEQLQHPDATEDNADPYPYARSKVTEDDAEFFDQLEEEKRTKEREHALQDERELQQFRRQSQCIQRDQPPLVPSTPSPSEGATVASSNNVADLTLLSLASTGCGEKNKQGHEINSVARPRVQLCVKRKHEKENLGERKRVTETVEESHKPSAKEVSTSLLADYEDDVESHASSWKHIRVIVLCRSFLSLWTKESCRQGIRDTIINVCDEVQKW